MYDEQIRRIVEASNNHSLTFFVGAGVSSCSNAPTWKKLVNDMCVELSIPTRGDDEDFSSDEYIQIPQKFYQKLGCNEKKFRSFVNSCIGCEKLAPNEVHRMLLELEPASFMTTNYDTLLEDATVDYCQAYKTVAENDDVPCINGDKFILKVHGDLAHKHFVLKEDDYLDYEDKFQLISTISGAVFSSNTVVFIGYRLSDYNIKLVCNWVRRILKKRFNPIFVVVEKEPLREDILKYYEGRGLDVVEYAKLIGSEPAAEKYIDRYMCVLKRIIDAKNVSLQIYDESSGFDFLYNALAPLDQLSALRKKEIRHKIGQFCFIEDTDYIYLPEVSYLFSKYVHFCQLNEADKKEYAGSKASMYNLISRVLKKAMIFGFRIKDNQYVCIDHDMIQFADMNCISFDYKNLIKYCNKEYKTVEANFKKAFYLTRLRRYSEAYKIFSQVARDAYISKKEALCYLAQINSIILRKVLNNERRLLSKEETDEKSLIVLNEEEVFNCMPVEFRNSFNSLKDLVDSNILYRYAYEAFHAGKKMASNVAKHSTEYGNITSSSRVIGKVNEYLHFLLGNGICVDLFTEYLNSLKYLMEQLIYKYAEQTKIDFISNDNPLDAVNHIEFDQIDFYCLIKSFSAKELVEVFEKNECSFIKFDGILEVEVGIRNAINHYEKVLSKSKDNYMKRLYYREIASCITLASYMELSVGLVEDICRFILKHEFEELWISDKYRFLEKQIHERKCYNNTIKCIIEDVLISYMKKDIDLCRSGKRFKLPSTISSINYYSLADFLYIDEDHSSRKISPLINEIIELGLTEMIESISRDYWRFLSHHQKEKVLSWVDQELQCNFSFDYFKLLVEAKSKKYIAHMGQLVEYLKTEVDKERMWRKSVVGLSNNSHLIITGFWCFSGALPKESFSIFKGMDLEFDFFYDPSSFDYDKFNLCWLTRYNSYILGVISKNERIKEIIRTIFFMKFKEGCYDERTKRMLERILLDYFV